MFVSRAIFSQVIWTNCATELFVGEKTRLFDMCIATCNKLAKTATVFLQSLLLDDCMGAIPLTIRMIRLYTTKPELHQSWRMTRCLCGAASSRQNPRHSDGEEVEEMLAFQLPAQWGMQLYRKRFGWWVMAFCHLGVSMTMGLPPDGWFTTGNLKWMI